MPKKARSTLKKVTLKTFFEEQGIGSQDRMARAVGVSKATISNLKREPPRSFAGYAVAKAIRAHMEAHGYTIDIESLVRTEGAYP